MLTKTKAVSLRAAKLSGAIVLAMALILSANPARAQQDSGTQLILPGSQNEGSTLTLPAIRPQSDQPDSITISPQRGTGPTLKLPSRQLCDQPGYAQIQVTVTNPSGQYVNNLNRDDFSLYVNGAPRKIDFFRRDSNAPASVGIVVDTSGSMVTKLPQARLAIAEFLRELNPNDDVFLYSFNHRPFLLQAPTTDHQLVMAKLTLLHAYGNTALYDAIMYGMHMLEKGRYDKRVLLVVTDGMDNASEYSMEQVIGQARRMGVLIYSIGIGNPNSSGVSFTFGPFAFGGGEDEVDAKDLRVLSTETGAKTFIIPRVGDGAGLRADTEQIGLELRQQYTLGFVARHPDSAGYRNISVGVARAGDLARVRKGITISRATTQAACADLRAYGASALADPR